MKRELIHVEHYSHKDDLREYSLTVRESENIYIFSDSVLSLNAISELIKNIDISSEIYKTGLRMEFTGFFSVADNFVEKKPFYALYSRKHAESKIYERLQKAGITIDVSRPFFELTKSEQIALSIFNAIYLNKKIIILNLSEMRLDSDNKKLISDMIKRFNNLFNTSFIILSQEIEMLADFATVIQYVRKGTVVWEFSNIEQAKKICSYTKETEASSLMSGNLIDADILFDNLSISENLVIGLKEKCALGLFMPINRNIVKKITNDFYTISKIDKKKQSIFDLTFQERQLLIEFINRLRRQK